MWKRLEERAPPHSVGKDRPRTLLVTLSESGEWWWSYTGPRSQTSGSWENMNSARYAVQSMVTAMETARAKGATNERD